MFMAEILLSVTVAKVGPQGGRDTYDWGVGPLFSCTPTPIVTKGGGGGGECSRGGRALKVARRPMRMASTACVLLPPIPCPQTCP